MKINQVLAQEFHLRQEQVDNTIALIDDDKTIPFIARYRKELTGSLDDQVLRELFDRLTYLRNLEKRKAEVCASIEEQEKMTDEIRGSIDRAKTLVEVEDLYRPFKPKRKTRASIARARGLEPLSVLLSLQNLRTDPVAEAQKFVSAEQDIPDAQAALQGAMDIIAEDISDDAELRKKLRAAMRVKGHIASKATDPEAESVYQNYYESMSRWQSLHTIAFLRSTAERRRAF